MYYYIYSQLWQLKQAQLKDRTKKKERKKLAHAFSTEKPKLQCISHKEGRPRDYNQSWLVFFCCIEINVA